MLVVEREEPGFLFRIEFAGVQSVRWRDGEVVVRDSFGVKHWLEAPTTVELYGG